MNALIQCAECDGPPKVVVPPFHNGEPVTKFWIGCCSSWRSAFEWTLERTSGLELSKYAGRGGELVRHQGGRDMKSNPNAETLQKIRWWCNWPFIVALSVAFNIAAEPLG